MIGPADDADAAANVPSSLGEDHDEFAVLAVLVETAREESGWYRRGVRGWLFYKEIATVLGTRFRMPFSLRELSSRRGLVTGLQIRDFARGRVHLYRASELGSRLYDQALGREHVPLAPTAEENTGEDARTLFMPLGGWAALTALIEEQEKRLLRPRWGEHGWLTTSEMCTVLATSAWIDTMDLYWLERRKLIERRYMPNPGRPLRPQVYWRVTKVGERARVVDDYGIMSGLNTVVQVEIVLGNGPLRPRYARPLTEILDQHRHNIRVRCGLPSVPNEQEEVE